MFKLFKTIKSIFNAKVLKLNRKLQIDNCIDLVKDQQLKMAESFKKISKAINDIKYKIKELSDDLETEKNKSVKEVKMKNVAIFKKTLDRLVKNKELLEQKLWNSKNSRDILTAKKSLLDSIESIKGTTSNIFENQNFDIDSIMKEIDDSIRDIETEMQCDEELNEILKK